MISVRPNIICIEDRESRANNYGHWIKADFPWIAYSPIIDTDCGNALFKKIVDKLEVFDAPIFAMILDINLSRVSGMDEIAEFGGIHIYNKLCEAGLGDKWVHTIVSSTYGGKVLTSPQSYHSKVLAEFMEGARIPPKHSLCSRARTRQELIPLLHELVTTCDFID